MRNSISASDPASRGRLAATHSLRQDSGDANSPKDPEFASPDFLAFPQSTQTKELPT